MTNFSKTLLGLTLGGAALCAQDLGTVSISALAAPEATVAAAPVMLEAAERPAKWGKLYNWSVEALGAATAADMASSFKFSRDGQREGNALLQSGNGGYGVKGAVIEAGIVGASLLVQHYLVKRHPGLRVPLAISNYAFAGFQVFNVRHNLNY